MSTSSVVRKRLAVTVTLALLAAVIATFLTGLVAAALDLNCSATRGMPPMWRSPWPWRTSCSTGATSVASYAGGYCTPRGPPRPRPVGALPKTPPGVLTRSALVRTHQLELVRTGDLRRHLGQNVYLAATALNLGPCGIGACFDDDLNRLLGVDARDDATVYLLGVGAARA